MMAHVPHSIMQATPPPPPAPAPPVVWLVYTHACIHDCRASVETDGDRTDGWRCRRAGACRWGLAAAN
jgi:hypothetical protein